MVGINFPKKLIVKLTAKLIEKLLKKPLIFLIKIYQYFFSYLLRGYECRFHPTCSNYMLEAIEKKGLIKGFLLGIWRILNCQPFSKKDRNYPVK